MPARWWKHGCRCGDSARQVEACGRCGACGQDLGWCMTEQDRDRMFLWGTGLERPAEEDVSEAAEAIRSRLVACTLCDRTGLLQSDGPKEAWAWPGQDIGMSVAPRHSTTGYMQQYPPVRRDLDDAELAHLRKWLRDRGFRHTAPVVPAIVCGETGRVAVGARYRVMLAPCGRRSRI